MAIKRLFDPSNSEENKEEFLSEIRTLKTLRHPNIITMMGYRVSSQPLIVFEHVKNGSLFNLIFIKKGKINKEGISRVLCQTMEFIHNSEICHRDLKPHNILLDSQGNPKIIDFGLARKFSELHLQDRLYCGTPHYSAPEIFLKQKITPKIDVWAFGIILFEIFSE